MQKRSAAHFWRSGNQKADRTHLEPRPKRKLANESRVTQARVDHVDDDASFAGRKQLGELPYRIDLNLFSLACLQKLCATASVVASLPTL
jgi:hypothetical protein